MAMLQNPRSTHAVIGGIEVPPNTYPWLVRVEHTVFKNDAIESHRLNPNSSWMMSCGGSLINERWVLTAAHCIEEQGWGNKNLPLGLRVILGDHIIKPDGSEEPSVQVMPVAEIVVPPNYGPAINDIALLRLHTPVAFPSIALAKEEEVRVGDAITIAGWGVTSEGGRASAVVRFGQGTVASLTGSEINSAGGAVSGFGDSGGPLMVRTSSGMKLAGIVSTRNGYTSVSKYVDWIAAVQAETLQGAATNDPYNWLSGFNAEPSRATFQIGTRSYDMRCIHGSADLFTRCWTRVTERLARGGEMSTPWMGRSMLQERAANANLQCGNCNINRLQVEQRGDSILIGFADQNRAIGLRAMRAEFGNQLGSAGEWLVLDRTKLNFLFAMMGLRM